MEETFEKSLKSGKPVLAAFISAGKEAEKEIGSVMDKVTEKFGNKVSYVTIDCAYHTSLRKKYQIDNYPTFILFKGEEEIWRGNTHKPEVIEESINTFVE